MLDGSKKNFGLDTSFYGRVRNLSLPANQFNSLVPLFEAVMNAIHGIEDKFGSEKLASGKIIIDVIRHEENDRITKFRIADNGVGFTDDNLKSFFQSDSMHKFSRGGKGVGRLSWLKAFSKTSLKSVHEENGDFIRTSFEFLLDQESQVRGFEQVVLPGENLVTGVIAELGPYETNFGVACPRKTETIVNKIISHFLPYFLTTNVPQIIINDDDESYELSTITESLQQDEKEFDLKVEHENGDIKLLTLNCFKIPKKFTDDEKGNNAVYYVANSRVVKRVTLDSVLGLSSIGEDLVFCGTVTGEYCDLTANQERTAFNWSEAFFKDLHSEVIEDVKDYLINEISEIREIQSDKIKSIGREHPRFFSHVNQADAIAEELALGTQKDEDIFLELSRRSLRKYKKQKKVYTKAIKTRQDLDVQAKKFVNLLQDEALGSLAECVYKRKLILDLMDTKMEYLEGADKKKALEETVHEIICPLGVNSDGIAYNDHNLWIIDDSLAFYTYFGSDQSLKKVTQGVIDSAKEPDLLFFDEGLGFNRDKSDQPITIIEFKRPGRNDYSASDNPITQVRKYVTAMRKAGAATTDKGKQVKAVDENTYFMCHIIADITPTLSQQMKDYGTFSQRAGHNSFYKWDDPYKIFIEVSSYQEVLDNAKARHEDFFTKLGISA